MTIKNEQRSKNDKLHKKDLKSINAWHFFKSPVLLFSLFILHCFNIDTYFYFVLSYKHFSDWSICSYTAIKLFLILREWVLVCFFNTNTFDKNPQSIHTFSLNLCWNCHWSFKKNDFFGQKCWFCNLWPTFW